MASWTVVPCLLTLRDEFNAAAPGRDKGADGTIGDSSHTSSSDHTPDEDSDVLRDHDADSKNEVHALDIDSTGPWPWSFDAKIKEIAEQERADYEHPTIVGRLQYVIWDREIISRNWGWSGWRPYTGSSPHTDHAHFSARYVTEAENSTRPWRVNKEDEMELDDHIYTGAPSTSWTDRFGTSADTVRNALAFSAFDSHDGEKATNQVKTKVDDVGADVDALTGKVDALANDVATTDEKIDEMNAKLDQVIAWMSGHASGIIEGAGAGGGS